MVEIRNLTEAEAALSRFIPSVHKSSGRNMNLQRMQPLMEALGNPQNNLTIIHIAGTSGKTSTAYYIASMLKESGKKVGLTISPHAAVITERFQVNMRPLSEKTFCKALDLFLKRIENVRPRPGYLDVLIAFAYWYFERAKLDYVVVETGMGGLHDSTNIAKPRNKICVITDIGLDHTAYLGPTIDRIASQKAGIIRPHNTVFCYEQDEQVMRVIREVSDQQHAELHEIWPVKSSELPRSLPLFQRRNWYLAWSVFSWIQERDGTQDLTEQQLAKTTQTYIPARMEEMQVGDKTVILDGSHNAQKLHALVGSIRKKYPKQKLGVLVGFLQTKQASLREDLTELLPITSRLVATSFSTGYMPTGPVSPAKIADNCEALGMEVWEIIKDPEQAFRNLLRGNDNIVLVTGSFYLLNHIRPIIMNEYDKSH